jgi:cell division protein FtsI/penicillin-binding protein 2
MNIALPALLCCSAGLAGTLYNQSITRALTERFSDKRVSYILLDAATGDLIAQRWPSADASIPVGSLVKPLLILASPDPTPRLLCRPAECWQPAGHGELDSAGALAHSCNSYFLQLAAIVTPDRVAAVTRKLGLDPPAMNATPQMLIGLSTEWRLSPLALTNAYREIAAHPVIAAGMRSACSFGTARKIQTDALAKTGTAACSDGNGPGDGFTVALYPANRPRYILLVRVHGTTGAASASIAGQMLRLIANGS